MDYTPEDVLNTLSEARSEGIFDGVFVLHPIAFSDLGKACDSYGHPVWVSGAGYLYGYRYQVDPDAKLGIEFRSAA